MAKKYSYEVWIGHKKYNTKATDSRRAKRNVAHMHRNRGYTGQGSIQAIMESAIARRR